LIIDLYTYPCDNPFSRREEWQTRTTKYKQPKEEIDVQEEKRGQLLCNVWLIKTG